VATKLPSVAARIGFHRLLFDRYDRLSLLNIAHQIRHFRSEIQTLWWLTRWGSRSLSDALDLLAVMGLGFSMCAHFKIRDAASGVISVNH